MPSCSLWKQISREAFYSFRLLHSAFFGMRVPSASEPIPVFLSSVYIPAAYFSEENCSTMFVCVPRNPGALTLTKFGTFEVPLWTRRIWSTLVTSYRRMASQHWFHGHTFPASFIPPFRERPGQSWQVRPHRRGERGIISLL